jgi:hypothetical protein
VPLCAPYEFTWVCFVDDQKNLSGTIHRTAGRQQDTGRPFFYLEEQPRSEDEISDVSHSASFSADTVRNRLAANYIAIPALQTLTLL